MLGTNAGKMRNQCWLIPSHIPWLWTTPLGNFCFIFYLTSFLSSGTVFPRFSSKCCLVIAHKVHNHFFLSGNAPSHSAKISGDTLNRKGLSIFFRSSAPSQVTDTIPGSRPPLADSKSCAALFIALLCNSYSHYRTVTKKGSFSSARHCLFYCK